MVNQLTERQTDRQTHYTHTHTHTHGKTQSAVTVALTSQLPAFAEWTHTDKHYILRQTLGNTQVTITSHCHRELVYTCGRQWYRWIVMVEITVGVGVTDTRVGITPICIYPTR